MRRWCRTSIRRPGMWGGPVEFRILGSFEVVGPNGPAVLGGAKRPASRPTSSSIPDRSSRLITLSTPCGTGNRLGAHAGPCRPTVSQLRKLLAPAGNVSLETRPGGYVLEVPARLHRRGTLRAAVCAGGSRTRRGQTTRGSRRSPKTVARCAAGRVRRLRVGRPRSHPPRGTTTPGGPTAHGRAPSPRTAHHRDTSSSNASSTTTAWTSTSGPSSCSPTTGRAGRPNALPAYQRVRLILAEELGIEPGDELSALERKILDHDPSLLFHGLERIRRGCFRATTSGGRRHVSPHRHRSLRLAVGNGYGCHGERRLVGTRASLPPACERTVVIS